MGQKLAKQNTSAPSELEVLRGVREQEITQISGVMIVCPKQDASLTFVGPLAAVRLALSGIVD